jgi:hypothetical protein
MARSIQHSPPSTKYNRVHCMPSVPTDAVCLPIYSREILPNQMSFVLMPIKGREDLGRIGGALGAGIGKKKEGA